MANPFDEHIQTLKGYLDESLDSLKVAVSDQLAELRYLVYHSHVAFVVLSNRRGKSSPAVLLRMLQPILSELDELEALYASIDQLDGAAKLTIAEYNREVRQLTKKHQLETAKHMRVLQRKLATGIQEVDLYEQKSLATLREIFY